MNKSIKMLDKEDKPLIRLIFYLLLAYYSIGSIGISSERAFQ